MFAWLSGWEVVLILLVVLLLFSANLGGGSSGGGGGGGGGIGSHPLTVCDDILEWIVKAKEELWVRFGRRPK